MITPRAGLCAALLIACVVGHPAAAVVTGTAPTLFRTYRVQGSGKAIGNTLMTYGFDPRISEFLLAPQFTAADLTGLPINPTIEGAFVFYSGRTDVVADDTFDFYLPDGRILPLTADMCLNMSIIGESFFYCRRDVTALVQSTAVFQGGDVNGTYNVNDVTARPGVTGALGNGCAFSDPVCQAAYAGWSMVVVWSSSSAPNVRDLNLYDGFYGLDENASSSGVSPPISVSGFTVTSPPAGEITVFALEGDPQLGSPPHPLVWADYLTFTNQSGTSANLTDSANPPNNFFNSTLAEAAVPFNGVDIDRIDLGPTGMNLLQAGDTTATLRPGSGDGVVDGLGQGEFFILGYMLLAIDSIQPRFGPTSSKSVDKTLAGAGETLTYTVFVENTGNDIATNVVVKDSVPVGTTYVNNSTLLDTTPVADVGTVSPLVPGFNVGTIDYRAGTTTRRTITWQVTIDASVTDGTVICNQATVDSDQTGITPLSTVPCTVVQAPALRDPPELAVLDINGGLVEPGDRLRYTVSIYNDGNQVGRQIHYLQDLPPYVKSLSVISIPPGSTDLSISTGGANGTGRIELDLITVPGLFQVDILYEVTLFTEAELIAAGIAPNAINGLVVSTQGSIDAPYLPTAYVTDDPSTVATPDPTVVVLQYDVDLSGSTKVGTDQDGAPLQGGDTVQYVLRVRNDGNRVAIVTVVDDLPAETENCVIVSAPPGTTCTGTGGANGTGQLLAGPFTLAPGAEEVFTFTVDVRVAATDGATVQNLAQLTAAETTVVTNVASSGLTVLNRAILSASTKTVVDDNGGATRPGDTLTYTLTVRNTGNRPATNVVVLDTVDPSLNSPVPGQGGVLSGSEIRWDSTTTPALANLVGGAQVVLTFTAVIDMPLPDGTDILNQGRITAPEVTGTVLTDDPTTVAIDDETLITVQSVPAFGLTTKTVTDLNGGSVRPGDRLRYEITVRNDGTENGTNTVVTDTVDPRLTIVQVDNGGSVAGNTITWALGTVLLTPLGDTVVAFEVVVALPLPNGTDIDNQGYVTSNEVPVPVPSDDPTTAAVDDATRVRVVSQADLSQTTKSVQDLDGGAQLPGDVLEYTITVTNTGDAPATNVTITDVIQSCLVNPVPQDGGVLAGAVIVWLPATTPGLSSIVPGADVVVRFQATIALGTPDGARCANQATLVSADLPLPELTDDPTTADVDDETVVYVESRPALEESTKVAVLTNDRNGDGTFSPGDEVEYTLLIRNTGTEPAANVTVRDPIPARLTNVVPGAGGVVVGGEVRWTIGTMAPGASVTLTFRADIVLPLPDEAVVLNQGFIDFLGAAAEVPTDDPATPLLGDPTRIVLQSVPDFSTTTKSVTILGGPPARPDGVLRYSIHIVNTGTAVANNLVITDPLDPDVVFVSASPDGVYDPVAHTVTWTRPTLGLSAAGFTRILEVRARTPLPNGTPIRNQAYVTSDELTTPEPSDDPATLALDDATVVTIVSGADLTGATKSVVDLNGGLVQPGDVLEWTVSVTNLGDAVATNVIVDDAIDPRLGAVVASDGGVVSPGRVLWTKDGTPALSALAPGDSVTLTVTTTVARPLNDGIEIFNQALLLADGIVAPIRTDDPSTAALDDATRVVVSSAVDLAASKTVTDVDGAPTRPGDALQWTITWINSGDMLASSVVVTDLLDSNTTFVSASAGGTYDPIAHAVTWAIGSIGLDAAGAVTRFLTTRIVLPLDDGTEIYNQASAVSLSFPGTVLSDDPSTPEPDDETTIRVVSAPNLNGSTKRFIDPNGGDVEPGDVLQYEIRVGNTGDMTARGVVVTDLISPDLTAVSPSDSGVFDPVSRIITWPAMDVPPGAAGQRVLRFEATVRPLMPSGVIANQGQITVGGITVLTDDPDTPEVDDSTDVTVVSAPVLTSSQKTVVDDDGGLVRPGDALTWTIVVTNTGNTLANNVEVRDPIDPNLRNVVPGQGGILVGNEILWNETTTPALESIGPAVGEEVTLTFTATIDLSVGNGVDILNQAHLFARELAVSVPTDDPTTAVVGDATRITVAIPDLSTATKTVTDLNGGDVEPLDRLRYEIRVTNTGALVGTGITIEDDIDPAVLTNVTPEGGGVLVGDRITWTIGTLDPGQTVTVRFVATVVDLLPNDTPVSNQARVNVAELVAPILTDDPTTPLVDDPTVVRVVSSPVLTTSTKTLLDQTGGDVIPGDSLRYTITVVNTGSTYATDVVVTDVIDPSLVDVVSTPTAQVVGVELRWTKTEVPEFDRLPPGQPVVLTVDARVLAPLQNGTLIRNSALVIALETRAQTNEVVSEVVSAPKLDTTEKTVVDLNGGFIEPGDILEYTIVIVNDGTEAAENVVLTDFVPSSTTYVPQSTFHNGELIGDAPDGTPPLQVGLLVRSARPATPAGTIWVDDGLPPDDEVGVVTFRVRVEDGAIGGTVISNQGRLRSSRTAEVRTDDPSVPGLGNPTDVVVGEAIHLADSTKTWALGEDNETQGVVEPGDTIVYTIVVPNRGTVDAFDVEVRDVLPAGVDYEPGTLTLDGAPQTDALDSDAGRIEGDTVIFLIPRIGRRELVVLTFEVRVRDDAPGTLVNQADITGRAPDGGLVAVQSDADPGTPGDQPTVTPVGDTPVRDLSTSVKSVEDVNGGRLRRGDLLWYQITVRNTGNVPVESVRIRDDIPAGTTFVEMSGPVGSTRSFDAPPEGAHRRGRVVVTLAEPLPAGESVVIEIFVRVDDDVSDGRVIENVAKVEAARVEAFDLAPARIVVGATPGSGGYAGQIYEVIEIEGSSVPERRVVFPNFTVTAQPTNEPDSDPVRTAVSDARGDYVLLGLPVGEWTLRFFSTTGVQFARVDAPPFAADQVVTQDGLIDPSGVIYREDDGTGVAGTRVFLLYDASRVGEAPLGCDSNQGLIRLTSDPTIGATASAPLPRPVGEACLQPGQQGQQTASGAASGFYRFDVQGSVPPMRYQLQVVPPVPHLAFPSVARPPSANPAIAPPGEAVPHDRPDLTKDSTYYLRFEIGTAADEVTNNHVPLDVMADLIRFTKVAARTQVSRGDLVSYTVTLANMSGRDMLAVQGGVLGGVVLQDAIPPGFRYVEGSAFASRLVVESDGRTRKDCPRVDQDILSCPSRDRGPTRAVDGVNGPTYGGLLSFGPYDVPAGESLELNYTLVVAADATRGEAVNRVTALLDNVQLGVASATVRIVDDPLFDQGTIFGKVFCDENRNGMQDPGDIGVPGVRIYADHGHYATTDRGGKYHLTRIEPGMRLFKVDETTLPPASLLLRHAAQPYYMTPGLDTSLDFAVECGLEAVAPSRVGVVMLKAPGEVEVAGRVSDLSLSLGGQTVAPLGAKVRVTTGDTIALFDLDPIDSQFGAEPLLLNIRIVGESARFWLRVAKLPEAEPLGSPAEWTVVWEQSGEGLPPETIEVPDELESRTAYAVWLVVQGKDGLAARSPIETFGWDWLEAPPAPVRMTLVGNHFPKQGAAPTKLFKNAMAPAIAALQEHPEATIRIEIHVDKSYRKRAAGLSKRRAAAVRGWLLSEGIAEDRITMVSMGSKKPRVPNIGRRNQRKNRRTRIVVRMPPVAARPVPTFATDSAATLWPDSPLDLDEATGFRTTVEFRSPDAVVVGLAHPNGATFGVSWPFGRDGERLEVDELDRAQHDQDALEAAQGHLSTGPPPAPPQAPAEPPAPTAVERTGLSVRLELAEGDGVPSIALNAVRVELPLLALEVLREDEEGAVQLGARRVPRSPIPFLIKMPEGFVPASWSLEVLDENDVVVATVKGEGKPPSRIEWKGRAKGKSVLERGHGYRYRFNATDDAGNQGRSTEGSFAVAGKAVTRTLRGLFVKDRLPPIRRVRLADFAEQVKGLGADATVWVTAHTHNKGGVAAAKTRTRKHVKAVAKALVGLGIPRSAIKTIARGADRPLVPNLSKRNREKNQRLVLRAVPPQPQPLVQREITASVRVAGQTATAAGPRVWTAEVDARDTVSLEVTTPDGHWAKYELAAPAEVRGAGGGLLLAQSTRLGDRDEDEGGPSRAAPATSTRLGGESDDEEDDDEDADGPGGIGAPTPRVEPAPAEPPPGPPTTPSKDALATPPPQDVPAPPPEAGSSDPTVDPFSDDLPLIDPPVAPEPVVEFVPETEVVLFDLAKVDTAEVPAARTLLRLPVNGARVTADHLAIIGTTAPGNEVTVNGLPIEVDENGRIGAHIPIPRGRSMLDIRIKDEKGNEAFIEREVVSEPDRVFIMAMADTHIGTTGAQLAGVTDRTRLQIGPAYLHGRAVGYVKGDWSEPWGAWEKFGLTLHLDTAKTREVTYFKDLVSPDRHYLLYGDTSEEVEDVSAAGPFYASLSADDNELRVGNYRTKLGTGGLFQYRRTNYGAQLHLDDDLSEKIHAKGNLFVSDGDLGLRHGHAVLQGTGGSLYFLDERDVLEGSERLRVVVRDRMTGIQLYQRPLVRNIDYVFRAREGQVLLKSPMPSVVQGGWLGSMNLGTALAGHPMYLVADYEYRATPDTDRLAAGGYVSQTWDGWLTLGGGVLTQGNGRGPQPYQLWGIHAEIRPRPRSYLKIEFAQSRGSDATGVYSVDGGLTYGRLVPECLGGAASSVLCRNGGNAFKLEGGLALGDLLGRDENIARLTTHVQVQGPGFYNSPLLLDQGQLKAGGQLTWDISEKDILSARVDFVQSDVPTGTVGTAIGRTKRVQSTFFGARYQRREEKVRWALEYSGGLVNDQERGTSNTHLLTAGTELKLSERWTVLLDQSVVLGGDPRVFASLIDRLTTGAGLRYRLSEDFELTGVGRVRWNGENTLQLGVRVKTGDLGSVYVNERLTLIPGGGWTASSVIGAEQKLADGVRTYGEYQVDGGMTGSRGKAVLGLANEWRPTEGVTLSLNYEHLQVIGDTGLVGTAPPVPGATTDPVTGRDSLTGRVDGVAPYAVSGVNPAGSFYPGTVSRDAISGSAEVFWRDVKSSLRLELRWDNADDELVGTLPNVADRLQGVVLGNVAWNWTRDLSMLGRVNWASTRNLSDDVGEALWLETSAGLALRPENWDSVNLLFKYTRLIDQRPISLAAGTSDRHSSDIVSLSPVFETPWRLGISEKIAYKRTRISVGVGEELRAPDSVSHTILWINRLDFHATDHLDLAVEYRMLWIAAGTKADGSPTELTSSRQSGFLAEVAYRMGQNLRLGVGWNFTSFGDDELSRFNTEEMGPFLRIIGLF